MNAIVDVFQPGDGSLFLKPPVRKRLIQVNGETHALYRVNPCYKAWFGKWLKKRERTHEALFFTDPCYECVPYLPGVPAEELFLAHFKEILQAFSGGRRIDAAVVCEGNDSRTEAVLGVLKCFCTSVTVVTDEAFFEQIAESAMYAHGLSVTLRGVEEILGKEVLILLSDCGKIASFQGKCVIPLCEMKDSDIPNLLWDYTSEALSQSDPEFFRLAIRHCSFIREGEAISKLIFKKSKKKLTNFKKSI